jgi:hypothetical protein
LVGKLSGNQCSGRFSGPAVDTLEQVRTGVGGQGDAGVPEPLRDHGKGHVGGAVDFSNAEFSGGTVDFGPPATEIQDQPLIGQTPCPMQ